jgi:hypothetical protein
VFSGEGYWELLMNGYILYFGDNENVLGIVVMAPKYRISLMPLNHVLTNGWIDKYFVKYVLIQKESGIRTGGLPAALGKNKAALEGPVFSWAVQMLGPKWRQTLNLDYTQPMGIYLFHDLGSADPRV